MTEYLEGSATGAAWDAFADAESPVEREVAALMDVLRRERSFIAALDGQKVRELVVEKEQAAGRLAAAIAAFRSGHHADGDRAVHALSQAAAWAAANRMLIDESLAALGEALGLSGGEATYDARARLRHVTRSHTDSQL